MHPHFFSTPTFFTSNRLIVFLLNEGAPQASASPDEIYETAREETRKALATLKEGLPLVYKLPNGEHIQTLTKENLETPTWAKGLPKEKAPESLREIGILNEADLGQLYDLYRRMVFDPNLENAIARTLIGSLKRELAGKSTKQEKAEVVMKYGDFQDVTKGLFGKQVTNPEELVKFFEKHGFDFNDDKAIAMALMAVYLGREPSYIERVWKEV